MGLLVKLFIKSFIIFIEFELCIRYIVECWDNRSEKIRVFFLRSLYLKVIRINSFNFGKIMVLT